MSIEKLIEQCRDVGIDASADTLETIYRAKMAASNSAVESPGPRARNDFLYDLVSLNVGYVTQLARLGSAYSIYAHRFAAAVYRTGVGPPRRPETESTGVKLDSSVRRLHFEGAPGDRITRALLLQNASDSTALPVFGKLVVDDGTAKLDVQAEYQRAGRPLGNLEILPSETARVAVTITLPAIPSGRTARGILLVELGNLDVKFIVAIRSIGL